MKNHSFEFFCLAGLLLMSAGAAKAQLIDVNLTNGSDLYSGAAVLGSAGDTWNNVNAGSVNFTTSSSNDNSYNGTSTAHPLSLVDSTGALTGATLTTAGFVFTANGYGSQGNFDTPLFNDALDAWGQIASPAANTDATFTFAGLADNSTYQLELYTTNYPGGNLFRDVTFTTDLGSETATTPLAPGDNSFVSGSNYVTVDGLTDGSGNLVITVTAPSSNGAGGTQGLVEVTGLQAEELPTVVPEASTWAMMLAGLVTLVGVQRLARKV